MFALTLALAATAQGCDNGQSSFSIPPLDAQAPSPRYADACAAWATRFCDFQASCADDYFPWNPGQCVPRNTLECEIVASDPNVEFDAASAAACLEPDAGDCTQNGGNLCLGPGRAPLGAPCVVSAACASQNCAYSFGPGGAPSPCGVCRPAPCGGGCPAGQACSSGADGGFSCVTVAANGQPCSMPGDCASFYCAPSGTCGPLAGPGKACGDGTNGPLCDDPATFCDGKGTCRRYLYAGYGQSCAPEGFDQYQCTGFGTCDFTDNLCIPPAGDGEFCDDTQGLNCLFPANCVAHVCVFPNLASCASP